MTWVFSARGYSVQGVKIVNAGLRSGGKSSGLTNHLVKIPLFSPRLVRFTRRIVTINRPRTEYPWVGVGDCGIVRGRGGQRRRQRM